MGHDWTPGEKWLRSMTLMAEEVIPRLEKLVA